MGNKKDNKFDDLLLYTGEGVEKTCRYFVVQKLEDLFNKSVFNEKIRDVIIGGLDDHNRCRGGYVNYYREMSYTDLKHSDKRSVFLDMGNPERLIIDWARRYLEGDVEYEMDYVCTEGRGGREEVEMFERKPTLSERGYRNMFTAAESLLIASVAFGDLQAVKRYRFRRPVEENGFFPFLKEIECSALECLEREEELSDGQSEKNDDDKFSTRVLPFLRLPVEDYFEYLSGLPCLDGKAPKYLLMDFGKCYDECFREDVEMWKRQYDSSPTISDVLIRCFDVLTAERVPEPFYGGETLIWPEQEIFRHGDSYKKYRDSAVMKSTSRAELEDVHPFQYGDFWPPIENEMYDAINRVNLLMVCGVLKIVYYKGIW